MLKIRDLIFLGNWILNQVRILFYRWEEIFTLEQVEIFLIGDQCFLGIIIESQVKIHIDCLVS